MLCASRGGEGLGGQSSIMMFDTTVKFKVKV